MIDELFMPHVPAVELLEDDTAETDYTFASGRLRVAKLSMGLKNILIWNVRGLNARSHRDALKELVVAEKPSLVCLEETKMHVISDFDVMQILGARFDYAYLLADQTRRGILVAWLPSIWSISNVSCRNRSLLAKVRQLSSGAAWSLSVVYGPAREEEKTTFIQELNELSHNYVGPWLIAGDFNLIYWAEDKSNDRLNKRRMRQFRQFLSHSTLKELHLEGRLFTWSNERVHPTLECIDRSFHTTKLERLYPQCDMHSLASGCSDHAPSCSTLMLPLFFVKGFSSEVSRLAKLPFQGC
jgi:exonuclease III